MIHSSHSSGGVLEGNERTSRQSSWFTTVLQHQKQFASESYRSGFVWSSAQLFNPFSFFFVSHFLFTLSSVRTCNRSPQTNVPCWRHVHLLVRSVRKSSDFRFSRINIAFLPSLADAKSLNFRTSQRHRFEGKVETFWKWFSSAQLPSLLCVEYIFLSTNLSVASGDVQIQSVLICWIKLKIGSRKSLNRLEVEVMNHQSSDPDKVN